MCGIVGSLNLPNASSWIDSTLSELKRRGPDSQGKLFINDNLVMGVARLAMTDSSSQSNQPMIDRVSGDVISFNGEIYNFKAIRSKLILNGYTFQTNSDTEVLLKYLNFYGFSQISELSGMFALVYFNKSNNKLYFLRDKLGKKPLYYKIADNCLQWSSQVSSLNRKTDQFNLHEIALVQYLSLGYLLDPTTYNTVAHAFKPGELVECDLSSEKISLNTRQIYDDKPNAISSSDTGPVKDVIRSSIYSRTVGHDKVAISLSGGVDSAIVAIEASNLGIQPHAYSVNWSDSDKARYSLDSEIATKIAKTLKIDLSIVNMPRIKSLKSEIDLFLTAMGEPSNNPTGLSMMALYSRIQSDGYRLVLTGDGSDEIFGGYERYSKINSVHNLLHLYPKNYKRFYFQDNYNFFNSLSSKIISTQFSNKSPFFWLKWHWVFTPTELSRLLKTYPDRIFSVMQDSVSNMLVSQTSNGVDALLQNDHAIWLPMESNRKLDRISMFHSIEARSPFQDNSVIRWANTYMHKHNYRVLNKSPLWSQYSELSTMGVLKDKRGFTSPVGHWLRSNPALVNESIEFLSRSKFFEEQELIRLKTAGQRGNFRELMQLWTIIVLARWLIRLN